MSYSLTRYEGWNSSTSDFANVFIVDFFSHQRWAFGSERLVCWVLGVMRMSSSCVDIYKWSITTRVRGLLAIVIIPLSIIIITTNWRWGSLTHSTSSTFFPHINHHVTILSSHSQSSNYFLPDPSIHPFTSDMRPHILVLGRGGLEGFWFLGVGCRQGLSWLVGRWWYRAPTEFIYFPFLGRGLDWLWDVGVG